MTSTHRREQCPAQHGPDRLRCERTRGHEGTHRAETGQPPTRTEDGAVHMAIASWL